MPYNKSRKINNQHNEASLKEEERTPKERKQAERPPSLNGINKETI
ncbi:hypothetical protein [Paenibacillus xylaniclasticus]|nr:MULTISPECIES: hypothetical protein [Paenibacillus]GFN32335.1 hypothetical protein PCURB6_25950 [Paenibacillus curdlanolyticus]